MKKSKPAKRIVRIIILTLLLTAFPNAPIPNNPYTISVQAASMGQKNALAKAKQYLSIMSFSKKGLKKQLEFEGFTKKEATYGVKHCGANWKKQAAKKAKEYLNVMSFSKKGLIDQLIFDGFTKKQAQYGVKKAGY